jgi:hypothetical protein
VEVFVDSGDEGNFLIGSVDTDSLGSFALTIPTNTLVEQNVTATNTDPSGNTSPFARAVPVPGSRPANNSPALMYLPYIGR